MADLDDGPEQTPLDNGQMQKTIAELLPSNRFNLVITHSTAGEYTRHLRHEETAKAVLELWNSDRLFADELWTFAYEDGNRKYLPRAIKNADLLVGLNDEIWRQKHDIITRIYGFSQESFEAKTTPKEEAFWRLKSRLLKYGERSWKMKVLLLYRLPTSPAGLATQGNLLHRGLEEMGIDVHSVNFESAQEKNGTIDGLRLMLL